jgi:CheY-like chemotaxis protein
MDMIRSLLPSSITIDTHLDDGPFWVVCDPVQIEQVLLNLCINARDSMDGKGRIKVSLGRYRASGDRCAICSESVQGDWVSLQVQDSGKGISDVDMERIFEPFFTTKEREKGTGLGLSVVHGIVSSYDGHILVASGAGQGTRFSILFPSYDDDSDRLEDVDVAQAPIESAALAPGTRLLVVDDETAIQQLLKEALTSEGYEVEVCSDGQEAWQRLQERTQPVDLLITDQTMPHLSGLELVSKLREAGNSLPVVLCTGFSELVTEQALHDLDISHCMAKPVRLDQLKSKLRAILSARHSQSAAQLPLQQANRIHKQ